ncbi:MAG: hypothetical protein H0Z33_16385 [Bacillaceae bacterium]|nr:hypothetical protein [Bacillaceae bacterium]
MNQSSRQVQQELKQIRQQINRLSRRIEEIQLVQKKRHAMDLSRIKLNPDKISEWVDFLNSPKVKELIETFNAMQPDGRRRKKKKRKG